MLVTVYGTKGPNSDHRTTDTNKSHNLPKMRLNVTTGGLNNNTGDFGGVLVSIIVSRGI